jgi:hypothetical protein
MFNLWWKIKTGDYGIIIVCLWVCSKLNGPVKGKGAGSQWGDSKFDKKNELLKKK